MCISKEKFKIICETKAFPSDQKYSFENRNGVLIRQYSSAFAIAYNKKLDGMIERRMREAVIETGSFWFTAWVNAGSPDLKSLLNKNVSEEMKRQSAEQDSLFKKGKLWEKDHCVE